MSYNDIALELTEKLNDIVNESWGNGNFIRSVGAVTADLLQWWFDDDFCVERSINFHEGQKQAILNLVYCHEVLGVNSVVDLYKKIFGKVEDGLMEDLLKKVRDKSGITYESLKRDLENGTVSDTVKEEIVIPKRPIGDKIIQAERFILSALLNKRSYATDFDASEVYFNDEIRQFIADEIAFDFTDIPTLTDKIGEKGYEELTFILSAGDNLSGDGVEEKYFKDCVLALKKDNIDSDIKLLNAQYSAETDLNKRKELAMAILRLTTKLNEINGG